VKLTISPHATHAAARAFAATLFSGGCGATEPSPFDVELTTTSAFDVWMAESAPEPVGDGRWDTPGGGID
jgi:hypothetical protein